MKKILKWVLRIVLGLVGLIVLLFVGIWITNDALPEGKQGAEAEALAQKIWTATHTSSWDSVGAISWNFGNRQRHLWDKERHLARVQWNEYVALVNINEKKGIAYKNGEKVEASENDKLVEKAWQLWVNDSFWLNAPSKIFDPGTSRTLVKMEDGSEALLVQYSSGGVTPGDAYLWLVDENGLPKAWRLWVQIVPIKGLEFSWSNWMETSEGASISQTHESKLFTLQLSDIKTGESPAALNNGVDPFTPLFE